MARVAELEANRQQLPLTQVPELLSEESVASASAQGRRNQGPRQGTRIGVRLQNGGQTAAAAWEPTRNGSINLSAMYLPFGRLQRHRER